MTDFQSIPKIENPKFYLELAFSGARKRASQIVIKGRPDRLQRAKRIELSRIDTVRGKLNSPLMKILKSFPSIDQLPEFYLELTKVLMDYAKLKKSLGAIDWAVKKVNHFHRTYSTKIRRANNTRFISNHKREFYGRISSVVKQIKDELKYLENARRTMREFPVIKEDIKTAVITGFPNVGKTTLLFKLTGSKPEIDSYPFTTRKINVAYIRQNKIIQLLDVPGTLNRFDKMNSIEKQAYLAIKHLADLIIYLFDLTEPYPIDEQIRLYKKLKESKKKLLVYVSKIDIIDKKLITEFKLKVETDPEKLKTAIISAL